MRSSLLTLILGVSVYFLARLGPRICTRNKKETLLLLSKSECLTFVSEERWYNCCKLQLCYVPTRSKDVPKFSCKIHQSSLNNKVVDLFSKFHPLKTLEMSRKQKSNLYKGLSKLSQKMTRRHITEFREKAKK